MVLVQYVLVENFRVAQGCIGRKDESPRHQKGTPRGDRRLLRLLEPSDVMLPCVRVSKKFNVEGERGIDSFLHGARDAPMVLNGRYRG